MPETVLHVSGLAASYGDTQVLFGVDLTLGRGKIVTLLGRNGVGKTTTLRALTGMLRASAGAVELNGQDVTGKPSDFIARAGLAFCPEDRGIYGRLTVEENLEIAVRTGPEGLSTTEIFQMFPNLGARRTSYGNQLSGGEQQMLAIGRSLRTGAPVILMDEPTEGLAPAIVKEIATLLRRTRERGIGILLVEQNFRFAAAVADLHYVMDKGRIVETFDTDALAANETRVRNLLGV